MIIAIVFAAALILFFVAWLMWKYNDDLCYEAFITFGVIALIVVFIMGSIAFIDNTTKEATIARYQIKRDSLVFQLENNYYNNVVENGRENLMKEIYEFNATVVKGRINKENVWVGVFWPEDWYAIEPIDLNRYGETK